ncbi:MAG: hypothetical protein WBD16_04300 [Pyrinomonadaceae bacterium]
MNVKNRLERLETTAIRDSQIRSIAESILKVTDLMDLSGEAKEEFLATMAPEVANIRGIDKERLLLEVQNIAAKDERTASVADETEIEQ